MGHTSLNIDRIGAILEPMNIYLETSFQQHIEGDNPINR